MMAKRLHPDNRYTLPLATGTRTGTSTGTRGHDGWDEHWNEGRRLRRGGLPRVPPPGLRAATKRWATSSAPHYALSSQHPLDTRGDDKFVVWHCQRVIRLFKTDWSPHPCREQPDLADATASSRASTSAHVRPRQRSTSTKRSCTAEDRLQHRCQPRTRLSGHAMPIRACPRNEGRRQCRFVHSRSS